MNLKQLLESDRILFECRSGSYAYGTNTQKSDIDIKGIFYQTSEELISLNPPALQINDENNDISYYGLRRYIELAASANPNILELLFMPEECVKKTSPIYEELKSIRNEFVTIKCLETHRAYALAQIKKAKGRNKWVNNPQPKEKPTIDKFCYFISKDCKTKTPGRPERLGSSNLDLSKIRASSVEHCPGLYRIYHSNDIGKLFTDEQICCSSIPFADEINCFLGFLYLNESAYKRALTDHKNYWDWMNKRNPERWKLQEKGELDYDAKNMQHTIRLLLTAKNIVDSGQITVRFSGDNLEFLRQIRQGKFSYSYLINRAEKISSEIDSMLKASNLKPEMSTDRADEIFQYLMTVK